MEWRPLKNLLLFSQNIFHQQHYNIFSIDGKSGHTDSSFKDALAEVQKMVRSGHDCGLTEIAKKFSSSIVGTTPDNILKNFPSVVIIAQELLGVPYAFLSSISFNDQSLLARASKLWPDLFFSGLKKVGLMIHSKGKGDDNCNIPSHSAVKISPGTGFGLSESASVAFSFFLQKLPFHVLLPAVMNLDGPYLLEPSTLQELLLAKLSEQSTDYLILSLHLVLFWIHQIQSYYRIRSLGDLEHLFEVCFILVERLLDELLVLGLDFGSSTINGVPFSTTVQEVAEIFFCHPAIMVSLSFPLSCHEESTKGTIGDSLEAFVRSSKNSVHKMDHCVLKLLISTSNTLVALCDDQNPISKLDDSAKKNLVRTLKSLLHTLLLELRSRFDECMLSKNFVPLLQAFYAAHTLICLISPFKLFELVDWMFSRVEMNDLTAVESQNTSALSFIFCIASGAFDTLSSYLQHPVKKNIQYHLFWEMEEKCVDIVVFEKIYMKVLEFATCFKLELADECLLKAIKVMYLQKFERHQNFLLPLGLVSSRVIVSTPVAIISHCINRPSMTRAKLLFLLIEVSPLHMSVFGHLFSGLLNKCLPHKDKVMASHSDEDLILLLPAALSYLKSASLKFGKQCYKHFKSIPYFYLRILLNGFLAWKDFVSRSIFQIEDGEFLPFSADMLPDLFNGSLLGKSVHMLWFYLALGGHSMKKKRFKLFDAICPCSAEDGMLDCDVGEIDSYSLNHSFNVVNRVVAKISLCRILLFPGDCQIKCLPKESDEAVENIPLEIGRNREDSSRIQLINILVNTWQKIVEKFSHVSGNSGKVKNPDCLPLIKFLEIFILRNVFELVTKMHSSLIQLYSLPFLEKLTRLSLLHRFEDATTLKMLRSVLNSLSEGKFSCVLLLQLLLAHSQFATTIQSVSQSPVLSQVGVFSKPMSSILRSVTISSIDQNTIDSQKNLERSDQRMKQLEVIKLLRLLLRFKGSLDGSYLDKNTDINSRELISLLLSSYGAMLNEIDLEIYRVMHEIESNYRLKSGSIADMDYLWGSSTLRIRKERVLELEISANNMPAAEAVEERQRSQFRENLPIDPKLCVNTVLYFPYDRTASEAPISLNNIHPDNVKVLS